ncbi:MAG: Lrp/AsnC family transcriptional regulator [Nitrososphaerota archaeon]|nr:Lrp/AsnC family transcriptional regulator [Nitrososphaerota archaeon]
MDKIDNAILSELKLGIPLTTQPFNNIASKLGIPQNEVLVRLTKLKQTGVIRRFGATIKPTNIGLLANAVIAWTIPADRVDTVGQYLASFTEITHCYERIPVKNHWEYNLYTVMHAQKRQSIEQMTKTLSETLDIPNYVILYSKRNLKNNKTTKKENKQ